MSTVAASTATGRRQTVWFVRHFLEMAGAMMVGMFVYGALVGGLMAAAGSDLESARLGQPELFALGMAFGMSVPMVAWMRRRGHDWSSAAEMSAAMFVPVAALIVCYRLQAVSADSVCPIACAAMIPAMLVAMFNRHDEYTGHQPAESSRI